MGMEHDILEVLISCEGRELQRRLLEEHIKLRGMGDVGTNIIGADGIKRTHKRIRQRTLITILVKY